MRRLQSRRGMVLVFALWVLGILTILAVSVAAGIREKVLLVGHLDGRSRMNYLLQAAVKKTSGYIHQQMEMYDFQFTPPMKLNLLSNANELSHIGLNRDNATVDYVVPGDKSNTLHVGVTDEESKLNLNKADMQTLSALLSSALSLNDENAAKLALALLDWCHVGQAELNGFYGDDYYANLQYPYPKKSSEYESLDEILLVKGVNKELFDKLINYVTIYGDGAVNINTASKEVLMAIGLPESVVDKILNVRRGRDNLDNTSDDHVFLKTFEITSDINAVVPLTIPEAYAIDAVNARGLLTTNSFYYDINATGKLADHSAPRHVHAIYSSRDDKIVFWSDR